MKYLPFENITYTTKLDSEEILKRLNEIIEPKKVFRMSGIFGSSDHKPYEGSINGRSFDITRIIGYRNSFLPRINGLIQNDFRETRIIVKMRLHPFVIVFMLIWCGGVTLGFVAGTMASINNGAFDSFALIPFGMLLFGYGLTTGGFKYESIKSKAYFRQLFEAAKEV